MADEIKGATHPDVDDLWDLIFDVSGQQNITGLYPILMAAHVKWETASDERWSNSIVPAKELARTEAAVAAETDRCVERGSQEAMAIFRDAWEAVDETSRKALEQMPGWGVRVGTAIREVSDAD